MDRRNSLYYAAAAGTVLVFIIALIGLATCGGGAKTVPAEDQAVLNAYQQGYLDGYSKGYSEGFSAGLKSSVAGQSTATVSSSRGCAVTGALNGGLVWESEAGGG